MSTFRWTNQKIEAALALADGKSQRWVAEESGLNPKTIWRWMHDPEFSAEVDRLTLMIGIASRAERLRIAKKAVRTRVHDDGTVQTDRDLLDWLKYAQGETDGIKLDLAALADAAASVAGGG